MRLPGKATLLLTTEAMRDMLEDALNATRLPGEDRIRVLDVEANYSSGGKFRVELTTDADPIPAGTVTEIHGSARAA